MSLINVCNLSKDYKLNKNKKGIWGSLNNLINPEYEIKHAVNSISFSIDKGEMVGFVGPNGAGKSTTVKMLTGILVPTSGSITVSSLVPHRDRKTYTKKIGVVFGQRTQLWWDLPIDDTFDLLKHIYCIPNHVFKKNMEIFSDLLGLKDFLNHPVRQLSLGQRMRADIAAALLHDPEIIFFDEPTIGLDVVAKDKVRDFLNYINKEKNITMLFTTHDMVDIEKTCKRMIIIDAGNLIYDGTVQHIKDLHNKEKTIIIELNEKYDNICLPNVSAVRENDKKYRVTFNKDEVNISNLINTLVNKYDVLDLTIKEPEIESIIREIYGKGLCIDESIPRIS